MIPWFVLVLASAVLEATSNVIRKHVLNHEHALEQLAVEAIPRLALALLLIPFLVGTGWQEKTLIYCTSILLASALLYRNKGYRHLPISTVSPLFNFSPVILLLLAILLLNEQPTALQLLGIGFVVLGGYALDLRTKDLLAPFRKAAKSPYSAAIILGLVLFSFMALVDKILLDQQAYPVVDYLFWLYIFLGINTLLIHWWWYGLGDIKEDLRKGWYWQLAIAACSIVGILFFYQAIQRPEVLIALAVPVRRTSTLLEVIIGGRIFKEKNLLQKSVATGIMILGVLLIV